ncbi:hypothetical protein GO620_015715 [Mucilaginibacter ginkgonis]|uniref:Uncharacterized protein n=1 Tax=Mucilaginibacter ginkgonis TaxID=2682091 RepID=A0A6I4I2T8_9SPHI|nr:hypothetical protein GO620_015715 [Mucilaginibacter ginkgonis]
MIVLLSLIGGNFSRYFVYAGFELNQKYIAEKLCINKNRPWLHCNGRCYFIKKIKQAEEEDRKQSAKDNLNRLEVSFFQQPIIIGFIQPKIISQAHQHFAAYTYLYTNHYLDSIFRPPKAIA